MKHNAKTLVGLTAAAALVMTTPAALADTAESAIVKGGALNLRESASLSAKVLGQFPTGTLVEIIDEGKTWHEVEVGGKTGFMMAKYLNRAENPQAATVHTNSGIGLNLREEPDMKSSIITSVRDGGSVTVLQNGKDWCRVAVNGKEGFMATEYLQFEKPGSVVGKIVLVNNPKDTQVLNLRSEPNLDAKVIDYYYNNTRATILKDAGDWYKVQVEDGQVGYMMKKFLKLTNATTVMKPFQAKVFNVNGGSYVNLRKAANLSGKVIERVPVNATVTVLEHGTDWCKVDADGTEGYMSTWFLKW